MEVDELDDEAARKQLRGRFPAADPEDLLLLEDMLGIRDVTVALPDISPDARRRRLTALINAGAVERTRGGGIRHRGCALDR